jgi:hypothetical protein
MATGTYRIGTIVWDTSGTTTGTEGIRIVDVSAGAVCDGNPCDPQIALWPHGDHILNIIPEVVAVPPGSPIRKGVRIWQVDSGRGTPDEVPLPSPASPGFTGGRRAERSEPSRVAAGSTLDEEPGFYRRPETSRPSGTAARREFNIEDRAPSRPWEVDHPGMRSKTATPSGTWWKRCLSMVKITI